jgi:hypothetical protein
MNTGTVRNSDHDFKSEDLYPSFRSGLYRKKNLQEIHKRKRQFIKERKRYRFVHKDFLFDCKKTIEFHFQPDETNNTISN